MKARPGTSLRSLAIRYEPLDGFVLRAPLLPLDCYRALSRAPGAAKGAPNTDELRRLASNPHVRRALAVGSLSLLDALARDGQPASRASRSRSRLLRYLIRMATRPTPFGLFAGVAIGQWGDRTDVTIASGRFKQRTRPDMGWLMPLVTRLEAIPDVARRLRLVANPSVFIQAGRAFLAERVASGESSPLAPVSIRATGVVRRALAATRDPIPYGELAASLLASTAGATAEQIETLLTQLREHTFLLTDLRPPLTVDSPARYVVDRLAGISAADSIRTRLETTLATATVWDASPNGNGVERYRAMVERLARSEHSTGLRSRWMPPSSSVRTRSTASSSRKWRAWRRCSSASARCRAAPFIFPRIGGCSNSATARIGKYQSSNCSTRTSGWVRRHRWRRRPRRCAGRVRRPWRGAIGRSRIWRLARCAIERWQWSSTNPC